MSEFACVTVFSFIQMAVDQDSHTNAVMNIYVDHIPAVTVESGFSQYRKVCFIFHQNWNVEFLLQKTAQIRVGKGVIRSKKDLVLLDYPIDPYRDPKDLPGFLFILLQGFLYNAGKKRKELNFRRKRIFLHMAVFSFQIGDQGQDLPGSHVYGQGIAVLLVKLQKNRLSSQ